MKNSYGLARMRFEIINLALLLLLLGVANCHAQQNGSFLKFSNCRASSTYGNEFDATKALQPGTGYWSSAGHHSDDEEVVWTGQLAAPVQVKGIKVRWAYSPEEVQVSVSPDGQSWHVASPYKRTPSNEVSFAEDLQFPHLETAKAIMIQMKKSVHDFFGINNVSLIGGGEPLLSIIGGITSEEGEMCLQVEGGNIQKEGAPIVLDLCSNAIAMADGRELWKQNANDQFVSALSNPPMCITLQDSKAEDGGKINLADCTRALEEADGRSNWNIEANSQLRLQKSGSFCLTQKNIIPGGVGVADVAQTVGAAVKCESLAGTDHTADKVIDRDLTTYWASGAFDNADEQIVHFEIDLGKPIRVSSIRIDWEYPALSYKIEASEDGKNYREMAKEIANPSNTTLDHFDASPAQHIRIEMQKPHPTSGKIGEKYIYGIRELYVNANRLQTVVGDCRTEANSDDARDKYFVESSTEFDPSIATKIDSMDSDVLKRVEALTKESSNLVEAIPKAKNCLKEKKDLKKMIEKGEKKATNLTGKFQVSNKGKISPNKLSLSKGDSASLPAEDCFAIREENADSPSGFYWILPKCSSEPLRVFCDMKNLTSFYFWNGIPGQKPGDAVSSKVKSLEDTRLHCAEVGLEPFIPKSNDQMNSVIIAASQMGYHANGKGIIPLAYDYGCLRGNCSGSYHDLFDGTTDLTSLVLTNAAPNGDFGRTTAAGLVVGSNKTTLFDFGTVEIAALVCSTNSVEGESSMPHVDITCDATARKHEAFKGGLNTNIIAFCPAGCEEHSKLPVYGSGGVYSDGSSICRAAVHAGIIKSGGLVNVSLESPKLWYEGSAENGIQSKPLNKPNELELVNLVTEKGHPLPRIPNANVARSIRLGPVAKDCPIEIFDAAPSSFVELESHSEAQSGEKIAETPNEKKEDVMIDPILAAVMEEVLESISEMHGVDPSVVFAAEVEAADAVRESRKIIKPAEILQREEGPKAMKTYSNVEDLATGMFSTAGGLFNTLEELQGELEKLENIRIEETGFSSFKVDYKAMPFAENFLVYDSLGSKYGPSTWGYSERAIAGHKNAVAQTSRIIGNRFGRGAFALLKGHRFFDTIFHADIYAQGNGSIGVAFRMRDFENMYLLELNRERKYSRLLRIENGVATVLAQREDGAIEEAQWYRVRIETTHGYIKICIGKESDSLPEAFNVLDERFISGTVGLYSSGMNAAFFDNIRIKAKECSKISRAAPPLPLRCANFIEEYHHSPDSVYDQVIEDEKIPSGIWKYMNDFLGRRKVLAHMSHPVGVPVSSSFAMIDENKQCHSGHFSFDFRPADSIVGAVFRYVSPRDYHLLEIAPTEMRYRVSKNGELTTISSSPIFLDSSSWNSLELQLEGSALEAVVVDHQGKEATMQAEIEGTNDYGRIGILSRGGGAAFDKIQLSPSKNSDAMHQRILKKSEPWSSCSRSVHLIQRRDECQNMMKNEAEHRQVECAQNFCDECCTYQTRLLGDEDKTNCEKSCKANDPVAEKVALGFIQKLKQCVSATGDAFEHCAKDDGTCKLEACHFCCVSSEGSEDMKNVPKDLVKGMNIREVDECKYQCGLSLK